MGSALAATAYKVKIASPLGWQKFIGTNAVPMLTSTLSAYQNEFRITTSASANMDPRVIFYFHDDINTIFPAVGIYGQDPYDPVRPSFSITGGNIRLQAGTGQGAYWYDNMQGVTHVPGANTISKVTVSGGIVVGVSDINISTLTAGGGYWSYSSSLINNQYDYLYPATGVLNLYVGGSITAVTPLGDRPNKFGSTNFTGYGTFGSYLDVGGNVSANNLISNSNIEVKAGGTDYTLKWDGSAGTLMLYDIAVEPKFIIDTNTLSRALALTGASFFTGDMSVSGNSSNEALAVTGNSFFSGDLSVNGIKNFKIDHPDPAKTKNYYLIYSSLEGPEVGIYVRHLFKIENEYTVELPYYWKYFIKQESLQVICDAEEYLERETNMERVIFKRTFSCHKKIIDASILIMAERIINEEFVIEKQKDIS